MHPRGNDVESSHFDGLIVLYANVCGLMNKLHELLVAIKLYNVKIICITESHLSNDISDAEIKLENLTFSGVIGKMEKLVEDHVFLFISL